MKQFIIALMSIAVLPLGLFSQTSVEKVLTDVEQNNTMLSALRESADAEKIGNKTGKYLDNPEVEFNYLFGDPSEMGTRTDIKITQSFDFPTAYVYKGQIAKIKNEQADWQYAKELKTLLMQAEWLCYDLIYANALKAELTKRLEHAQSIADAFKVKLELGETNILEHNKAQLNLLNLTKQMESVEIERTALLSELAQLNGGKVIDFADAVFPSPEVSSDFDSWYAEAEKNNASLNWLQQEIEFKQKEAKLNRALSLPKIQAGYMSEKVVGEQFQGLTVGLAIPLWENKNTVKYAKAQSSALQTLETDHKLQLRNRLETLHSKAMALQKNIADYRSSLQALDNTDLLLKAVNKGEINLISYMLELSIYYESVNNLLDLEKDLNRCVAEMNQYM